MNVKKLSLASLFLVMACVCSFANTFVKVTKMSQLVPGNRYLLICEEKHSGNYAAISTPGNSAKNINVEKSEVGSETMYLISSDINSDGKPVAFTLGANGNGYTLYDTSCNKYFGLDGSVTYTDTPKIWTINETSLTFSNALNNEGGLFLLSQNGQYINFRGAGNHGNNAFTTSDEEFPMALYLEYGGGTIVNQTMITFGRSTEGDGDYYATVFYDQDFKLDAHVAAYGIQESFTEPFSGKKEIHLTATALAEPTEIVWANSPVLLKIKRTDVEDPSKTTAQYPIYLLQGEPTHNPFETNLTGTLNETTAPENSYMFGIADGVVGFWKTTSDISIPAHKAYLQVAAGSSGEIKSFNFSSSTGITEINALQEVNNDAIYNLMGQKISKNYKGVVLKNGKKFLNK